MSIVRALAKFRKQRLTEKEQEQQPPDENEDCEPGTGEFLHVFKIRNRFIRNLVLEPPKFKKLLELQKY